jgi:hypothetical protein
MSGLNFKNQLKMPQKEKTGYNHEKGIFDCISGSKTAKWLWPVRSYISIRLTI